ncbi:hypothetical protein [Mycobacterium camsae]|uniref:hypothetical protein n=1 Tax=Mycobacterium gordonae TaxID=1778 RepID=UPI00197E8277|nr:hypothetical protein [Mycobacterium gordonae]
MKIVSALAADLDILTAALDEPGSDVLCNVLRLATEVEAAVSSYLGLGLTVDAAEPPFTFTTLADGAAGGVRASLTMTMPGGGGGRASPSVDLVLYAGTPGSFVDLAADLAWLTGRPASAFALDRDVRVVEESHAGIGLRAASAFNQAIGVLISRGHTPAHAHREFDALTDAAGTDRNTAAMLILDAASSDSIRNPLG